MAQAGRSLEINVRPRATWFACMFTLSACTRSHVARRPPHTAGTNVLTNFQKFSLGHLADAIIADAAHAPFRAGPVFDAIVTDRTAGPLCARWVASDPNSERGGPVVWVAAQQHPTAFAREHGSWRHVQPPPRATNRTRRAHRLPLSVDANR